MIAQHLSTSDRAFLLRFLPILSFISYSGRTRQGNFTSRVRISVSHGGHVQFSWSQLLTGGLYLCTCSTHASDELILFCVKVAVVHVLCVRRGARSFGCLVMMAVTFLLMWAGEISSLPLSGGTVNCVFCAELRPGVKGHYGPPYMRLITRKMWLSPLQLGPYVDMWSSSVETSEDAAFPNGWRSCPGAYLPSPRPHTWLPTLFFGIMRTENAN